MNNSKIDKLIVKLIDNTISDAHKELLLNWLKEDAEHVVYFNQFVEINTLIKSNIKFNHDASLKNILFLIKKNKRRKRLQVFKYAAAVVLLISSVSAYLLKNKLTNTNAPNIVNTIQPGTNKAILTLQSGEEILLANGKEYIANNIKSNEDEIVYKAKENNTKVIEYNYLTIPRGGIFTVKLSDGTNVWLNSETQLKYPVSFNQGENRTVELVYGEAYFDVSPSSKNNGDRFVVLSKDQEIEVVGTKFNINTYDKSIIKSTLVEGRINLRVNHNKQKILPNQQAIYHIDQQKVSVNNLEDLESEVSWIRGVFSFKEKSFEDIMQVLARWYDVDVTYLEPKVKKTPFTGVLSKKQSLENILSIMSKTTTMKYEIKKNIILVK